MIAQGKRSETSAALGLFSQTVKPCEGDTSLRESAGRWKRVSAVAVALTNPSVATVDELFAVLVLADSPREFDRLTWRLEFGGPPLQGLGNLARQGIQHMRQARPLQCGPGPPGLVPFVLLLVR